MTGYSQAKKLDDSKILALGECIKLGNIVLLTIRLWKLSKFEQDFFVAVGVCYKIS